MKYFVYFGRWSPFHLGHKYIVDSHLQNGRNVCIVVRDSEEKYCPEDRKAMIEACYPEEINSGQLKVVYIEGLDVEGVCVGRQVGYYLVEAPEEIKRISGTKIRAGECFELPTPVKQYMKEHDLE